MLKTWLARLAAAFGLSLALAAPAAPAAKTPTVLSAEIQSNFPSCGTACITALGLRTVLQDLVDSYFNILSTATTNTVLAAPNGSTGAPSFRALVSTDIAASLGATFNSPGWTWPQQFFGQGTPSSNKLKTYAYGDNSAPGVFLNATQGAGVTGAGWTSLNTGASNISLGVIGFGFADGSGSTAANAAWGIYGECRAYVGSTGYCAATELDATNLRGSTVSTRPYSALAAGFTEGLHIASGGSCTIGTPCYDPANGLIDLVARQASHALLIGTNSANFDTGILFQCGSIGTTDCAGNGSGEAIRLYSGLNLKWYAPTDTPIFNVGVSASTSLVGALAWSNSGLTVQGGAGGILHQFYAGATDVNGVQLLSSAAAASPTVAAIGSDPNLDLILTGKGTGVVKPNALTSTTSVTATTTLSGASGGVTNAWTAGSVATTGAILSSGATSGVGYTTGAGGAITQGTSRSTTVILNKAAGAITLFSAAGSATPTTFTVTNSAVAATDVIVLSQKSGTDKYELFVTAVAAGSFAITFFTTGGTTTEQPVFNFAIVKGSAT